uniref:Suppressor of cytokine signaling 2 n=2 Tax=Latimeria chalumnae TaxID=7897 RepID=H3AA44_LATCH
MTFQSADHTESVEHERTGVESRVLDSDQSRIAAAMGELKKSGWYWGNLTAGEAKEILQNTSEGTFLIRNSSHSDYLLTISVKTSLGPTNLRIEYRNGKFRLDSLVFVKPRLKQFDSVVGLIQYYVFLSGTSQNPETVPPLNGTVQFWLRKPIYTSVPCLQHFCRIAINQSTTKIQE